MDGGSLRLEVGSTNDFAPFLVSSTMILLNSASVVGIGSAPSLANLAFMSGSTMPSLTALRTSRRSHPASPSARRGRTSRRRYSRHELGNGRNVRQRLSARLRRDAEHAQLAVPDIADPRGDALKHHLHLSGEQIDQAGSPPR